MPVYFGKGKVHGMSIGSKAITPSDLKRIEFSMSAYNYGAQSSVGANRGQPSGKRQHAPVFNFQAFSYSIESPLDAATGQVSGKRQHSPLKRQHSPLMISKEVDVGSPSFRAALASYQVLQTLNLNFTKTNRQGTLQPYLRLTLNTVSITGYRHGPHSPSTKDWNLLEEITFRFEKISVQYLASISNSDDWLTG